ncbi:hypothetical protein KSF78_0000371 [Schistosoma japonicum]|uniref:Protein LTV1 homolog n=1 Tax=Schistosoma japonicum TaxID=6182 RepID=Q5DDW0_SCHJA|nr:SJCHGC05703 protein [Schistosoma japonicum]KAH8849999.1 hypothetical protein KSF78_0000371 [Schistosoma japonicum]
MKKINKRNFKQCELKPVEKQLPKPLPGVPVHFNYGVFFDDDYDYMQHLKSADTNEVYAISVIPEDCASTASNHSDLSEIREPEVDYDEHIVDDLNMDSEAESFDTESELEDNFVELAGGNAVKSSGTDEDCTNMVENSVVNEEPTQTDISRISKDKVALMERFLYGINENPVDVSGSGYTNCGVNDYPDETAILNREFEKLMLRYKSRSNCGQSLVSGTSVMSEGLMYALGRDIAIAKQETKQAHWDFDDDLKAITLKNSSELNGVEQQDDSESSFTHSEEGTEKVAVPYSNSNSNSDAIKYNQLTMPSTNKTKKKSRSDGSRNNDDVIEFPKPTNPILLVREKGESAEQKRLRKAAIREHRQLRRKIRKVNQSNFRQEKERQAKNNTQTVVVH